MIFRRKQVLQDFAVLFCAEKGVKGCLFHGDGAMCRIRSFVFEPVDRIMAIPSACRKVLKALNCGTDTIRFLSGSPESGIFFRTETAALSARFTRDALELELPLHIGGDSSGYCFEFLKAGAGSAEGMVSLNVHAFRTDDRNKLFSMISGGIGKADHYLYPLMGVLKGDPPVALPEMEPEFCFAEGEWRNIAELPENWLEVWKNIFQKQFVFPEGFSMEEYLPCLFAARGILSGSYDDVKGGIDLIPNRMKPGRFRHQLAAAAVLLLLLGIVALWGNAGRLIAARNAEKKIFAELGRLNYEVRKGQSKAKSSEKEIRELTRVVNSAAGEPDILDKLARLSKALPPNVMVASFRLSESSLDLQLRSESDNLNFQEILKPFPEWKISSNRNFRRNSDSASMIFLKIVPADGEAWK